MPDAVILSAHRIPFGSFGVCHTEVSVPFLASGGLKSNIEKAGLLAYFKPMTRPWTWSQVNFLVAKSFAVFFERV